MKYLSAQEILVIHARIIDETGGLHGMRDIGLLASVIERPKTRFGGKQMFPGVFRKAAVHLEALVQYHCFLDGNKRTSVGVCARFLYRNRYEFVSGQREMVAFVLRVATKKENLDSIEAWIKSCARKRK